MARRLTRRQSRTLVRRAATGLRRSASTGLKLYDKIAEHTVGLPSKYLHKVLDNPRYKILDVMSGNHITDVEAPDEKKAVRVFRKEYRTAYAHPRVVAVPTESNPSIFDYEDAFRAGLKRGSDFPNSRIAPSAIEDQFRIWWDHEGSTTASPSDRAGNRVAYIKAFRAYTGKKPRMRNSLIRTGISGRTLDSKVSNPRGRKGIKFRMAQFLLVGKDLAANPPDASGIVDGPFTRHASGTRVTVLRQGTGRSKNRYLVSSSTHGKVYWGWVNGEEIGTAEELGYTPTESNPRVGTKDPRTMSAGEVNKELKRIAELDSVLTHEYIEAGRGDWRPSEPRMLDESDPLNRRHWDLYRRRSALINEVQREMGPGYYEFSHGWRRALRSKENPRRRSSRSSGPTDWGSFPLQVERFVPRWVPESMLAELSNLWHLSRTPKGNDRHARLIWTADEFHKAHPELGISSTAVYKDLTGMLEMSGVRNPHNPTDRPTDWPWPGEWAPDLTEDERIFAYAIGHSPSRYPEPTRSAGIRKVREIMARDPEYTANLIAERKSRYNPQSGDGEGYGIEIFNLPTQKWVRASLGPFTTHKQAERKVETLVRNRHKREWLRIVPAGEFTARPNPRTKLDLLLDTVKYAEHEVTLDVRGYTESQKQAIIDAAEKRGFHAASDGKHILIRDLRQRTNPQPQADYMYEKFHGKPPEEIVEIEDEIHVHDHLATLGTLVSMVVDTPTGYQLVMEFEEGDSQPYLCSNEDGTQLYIEGGDQAVDLSKIKMDTKQWVKDRMVLGQFSEPRTGKGEKWNITYRTQKKFDNFETIDYQHDLGEESGERPYLEYEPRNNKLYIAGGHYIIKLPFVGVSPGIED